MLAANDAWGMRFEGDVTLVAGRSDILYNNAVLVNGPTEAIRASGCNSGPDVRKGNVAKRSVLHWFCAGVPKSMFVLRPEDEAMVDRFRQG